MEYEKIEGYLVKFKETIRGTIRLANNGTTTNLEHFFPFQTELPKCDSCTLHTARELCMSEGRMQIAESFLRRRQSLVYSRIFQHFVEPVGLLPCSQEPFYPVSDESNL
jgi:hypothetical protein